MAETLRFTVLGRGDASDLDRLADAVDRITDQLKQLDRQRANPSVDVDTKRAEAKVGRFARDMHRTISRAIESLPDIDLDADASEAQREIREIRAALLALNDKRVGIDIGAEEAQREVAALEARLRRLAAQDVDVQVRTDAAAAIAQLQTVRAEADRLDGRTITVKVNTDRRGIEFLGNLTKALTGRQGLASFAAALMSVGAAATTAAAGVGGLAAAAGSVGAAFVATGPIVTAAAGMIGGVLATLKVGTQGLSQAFEALAEGDMKAWGKALANLSPQARDFASAIKDVWTELRQARGAVQDNLFQGMGEAVRQLARAELPVLREGMGAVATELNKAAKSVLEYVGSSEGIARQESMWASTATVVRNLSPAVTNVTAALFDIGEVGGKVLADITGGTGEAGAGFRQMVAEARASGELEQIMRRGVEVLRQLGSIAGNVGSILGSVFSAAQASGADFLSTLDRATESLANFLRSGTGQTALIDFFREARATLDILGQGLEVAVQAVARFVSAFAQTGGLQAFAQGITDIVTAVAPLLPALGELAGNTLGVLGSALSTVSGLIGPLVQGLVALLDAAGPIGPAIVAMAVAFRGLNGARAALTGLATSFATITKTASGTSVEIGALGQRLQKMGASESAVTRLSRAFTTLGSAIPIAAAALVGIIALYEQAASKADEAARAVANGSMSMRQAIEQEVGQLENRNAAYRAANIEGQEFASVSQDMSASTRGLATEQQNLTQATDNVNTALQEYLASLSPSERLQAEVAMAQRALNDAVVEFGENSPQAQAAAAEYAAALARQEAAEQGAERAAAQHNQTLQDRVSAIQTALGGMLQLEDALARVSQSEDAANEAARRYGENSDQAAAAVRRFAQDADAAAQAAQQHTTTLLEGRGATNAAEVGARTYAATLAQVAATSSGPARAGLLRYIDSLSDSQLAALNAQTAALGFKTELITLPSQRQVAIAVDPETGEIISTKALLDTIQDKTIIINGNAMPAQQALTTVLSQVAAGEAFISINGQSMPAEQALQTVLGLITSSSGTVTINGQAVPAETVLAQTIAAINMGAGTVTINGQDVPAQDVLRALIGAINSGTATVTINADGAPVEPVKQEAEAPTSSPHTVGDPVTDNTAGAKAGAEAPTGNPHTVGDPTTDNTAGAKAGASTPTGNPHTVGEPTTDNTAGAKAGASTPTTNPHTVGSPIDVGPVDGAKAAAQQPTQSLHTINCDDRAVVDAKGRAEQPTNSLHTINCDDSAVVEAKRRAQQSTSSTHTIHVRTVGAPIPRAAGGYATPRARGGYAQPAYMAAGGMRRMSAARAEIVPPRQPRVIGDRMRGDEAFIPINRSRRSIAILSTAAQRMGFGLVPAGMAAGGYRAMPHWPGASTAKDTIARELRELAAELRELAGRRDVTITNHFAIANAAQAADEVARTQRVAAATGIFG